MTTKKTVAMLTLTAILTAAVVFAAAPVPQSARGPTIPQDKGYLVQEIKDGLYWVTDGSYQTMFLTTGAPPASPSMARASGVSTSRGVGISYRLFK